MRVTETPSTVSTSSTPPSLRVSRLRRTIHRARLSNSLTAGTGAL
jgi:hypothetical protein